MAYYFPKSRQKRKVSRDSFDFLYFRTIVNLMSSTGERFDDNTDARMLFDAIRKGKQHLIRFILEAAPGDLANARDFHGKTPLMILSSIKEEFRRSSFARLLLYHGADINLLDDHGRTPLSHACERRCNDLVDIFVKHKDIEPDGADYKGNTPLLYCTMVGNDIGTHILIRHFRRLGLRIDHMNKDGYTPMLMAAKYGYISCARILFQQGQASLVSRNPKTNTSVGEFLEKNGYTLEDLLPLSKQLETKKRFMKIVNFARFTRAGRGMWTETTKIYSRSPFHRGSISTSEDVYEKDIGHLSKTHLRSIGKLPPVVPAISQTQSGHTKKTRKEFKGSAACCKHNGTAIIPVSGVYRHNNTEFHNVNLQEVYPKKKRLSESSASTTVEDFSEEEKELVELGSVMTNEESF